MDKREESGDGATPVASTLEKVGRTAAKLVWIVPAVIAAIEMSDEFVAGPYTKPVSNRQGGTGAAP